MKYNIIRITVIILMCISVIGNIILLSGCKTFEPVIIDGQPDECNDFYTVMKYYSVEGKDSAFVGTVYNECKTARTEKRKQEKEKHCKQLFYGSDVIDKNDYKKYNQYLECCKE